MSHQQHALTYTYNTQTVLQTGYPFEACKTKKNMPSRTETLSRQTNLTKRWKIAMHGAYMPQTDYKSRTTLCLNNHIVFPSKTILNTYFVDGNKEQISRKHVMSTLFSEISKMQIKTRKAIRSATHYPADRTTVAMSKNVREQCISTGP